MTHDERIRRAQEAERIWSSEIMREARETLEKALVEEFAKTPLRDDEGLRRVRMLYEAHRAYESFFRSAIDDGKLAQIDMERKQSFKERLRQVI